MGNPVGPSLLDGLGNGMGYALILIIIAFFRELLGSGALFGFKVFEAIGLHYTGNGLMLLPAGACIIVGLIIWVQRYLNGYREA
jgi:Na+-transporting NADH:ubiquinone oxidoreductase subunit D